MIHSYKKSIWQEIKRMVISAALILPMGGWSAVSGYAAPVISTIPSSNQPAPGAQITVAVVIDMTGTGKSLGAYTMTISWNPSVLQYVSVTGGAGSFSQVNSNTQNAASGSIIFNCFSTSGATGSVHVATLVMNAIGVNQSQSSVTPTMSVLTAATTFENLLSSHTISAGTVTITSLPAIAVTAPNGGENWNVGSTHSITWTSSNVTTVNITYSTNNGSSWSAVASGVNAAAQSYSWTVPNTASTQCLVKITNSADGTLFDVSNAVFTITGISISVTAPNGGENWNAGTTHSITWTSSNVATVNITYSTNNGSSWSAVASGVNAAAQSYSWTVPNTASTQCLVKITSVADGTVFDVSNAVFTITGISVSVTAPNGGEKWFCGTSRSITWTAQNVSTVTLAYTSDNGVSWQIINASVNALAGQYAWTPADVNSDRCRVRVTANGSGISDQSDAPFTILVNGLWGDVDTDGVVNVVDAVKIATRTVDSTLAALQIISGPLKFRSDVDADGMITVNDAQVCAVYEIEPNRPGFPARIGKLLDSVQKPSIVAATEGEAVLTVDIKDEGYRRLVTPAVTAKSGWVGALLLRLSWNPDSYQFEGLGESDNPHVFNSNETSSGILTLAVFRLQGDSLFVLPTVMLKHTGTAGGTVTLEAIQCYDGKTFQSLNVAQTIVAVQNNEHLPDDFFILEGNAPNPFNYGTTVFYRMYRAGQVKAYLYTITGQWIMTLYDELCEPGDHSFSWDGNDDSGAYLASGIYLCRVSVGGHDQVIRMTLMK
jgi:hypothetical protein